MRNSDRDLADPHGSASKLSGRLWNPAADVYRAKDGWIVKVDLAGICSDELQVEIHDS